MATFLKSAKSLPATLAKFQMKCTAEKEKRVKLGFEIALTDDALQAVPKNVKELSATISQVAKGVVESAFTQEFEHQELEVFLTPDSPRPALTLPNVTVRKLSVYRPLSEEGPSPQTFLAFEVHTGQANAQMLGVLLDVWRNTCFASFHEMNAEMFPETETKPSKAARNDGKMAAAGV